MADASVHVHIDTDQLARTVKAYIDEQVEPLIALVRDLADDSPCWYDHHGYCQGHGWMATDPACPHARAKALSAPQSGRDRPTHPDLPDEGRSGRDGETAGRDEAVCICPRIETTTFADLEAGERTFVRGKPNPNCPVCPDATERTEP